MKKTVIEMNSLTKQAYVKPSIKMMTTETEEQMLAGSLQNVYTSGLEDEDLEYDNDGSNEGSTWGDAW